MFLIWKKESILRQVRNNLSFFYIIKINKPNNKQYIEKYNNVLELILFINHFKENKDVKKEKINAIK